MYGLKFNTETCQGWIKTGTDTKSQRKRTRERRNENNRFPPSSPPPSHHAGGREAAACNYREREHEIAIPLGQETYNGSIMREIYRAHQHNGRRGAQDITVIPYFRADSATRFALSLHRAPPTRTLVHRLPASTTNYRWAPG